MHKYICSSGIAVIKDAFRFSRILLMQKFTKQSYIKASDYTGPPSWKPRWIAYHCDVETKCYNWNSKLFLPIKKEPNVCKKQNFKQNVLITQSVRRWLSICVLNIINQRWQQSDTKVWERKRHRLIKKPLHKYVFNISLIFH